MSRMFGDRINEFVLSVDIMNEETFIDLVTIVARYLEQQLGVSEFSVLEEGLVDNRPGLTTLWSTSDERPVFTVDQEAGYSSFSAYSFGENKPLWVVSASKQPLAVTDDYRELWSRCADLPRYRSATSSEVKTSVMHPLRREGQPIGSIRFGSDTYVEPTPASFDEVTTLAATISRAYRMYDIRETQKENTGRALRLLETSLAEESWTRLAMPQMFVAYAGADDLEGPVREDHMRVIATIRRVVGEFGDKVKAVFWEDVTESGDITNQVIRDITASEFGLCYFSEPSDGRYVDNPNVLFEAGMMQALTNSPGALFRAWIPVREERNSEALPFDVASQRMLPVDRTEAGELDEEAFARALRERMTSLVAGVKALPRA